MFFALLFAHIGFWSAYLRFAWPLSFSHFLLFTTFQTYLCKQRNSCTNMDLFSFPLHFGAGLSQRPWSQRADRARFNSSCRTVKQTAAALFNSPTFISPLPRLRLSASFFLLLLLLTRGCSFLFLWQITAAAARHISNILTQSYLM